MVGSLKTAAYKLVKYNFNLVAVQEVRWDKGGIQAADDYTFFHGNGNAYHHRQAFSVMRVEFISDMMTHITQRGSWYDIIILNVHAPTEDKTDDMKDSFYEELECAFIQFPNNHMEILLGDFNAKVGREDILKSTIWNESLHEISNDNGLRVVNFST
jgi:hypothetical protein